MRVFNLAVTANLIMSCELVQAGWFNNNLKPKTFKKD